MYVSDVTIGAVAGGQDNLAPLITTHHIVSLSKQVLHVLEFVFTG